jgi:hypothetical protein
MPIQSTARAVDDRCIMLARFAIAAGAVALLAATPAQAAQRPITLKLPQRGYTVVALAANGHAKTAKGTSVRLVPPAAKVTLQLIGPDGRYAGPVVTGRRGAKLSEQVRAGAKLGALKIAHGFARTKRLGRGPASVLAKHGAPVGAGSFGLVKVRGAGSAGAPGADPDHDGVPNAFDVDDNGNHVIDNVDRGGKSLAKAAQVVQKPVDPKGFWMFSNFKLDLAQAINANAGAVTDAQIDAALVDRSDLAIQVPQADKVELDCGGLTYCSVGGTGATEIPGPTLTPAPFPGPDGDDDGDGMATITAGPTGDFQLRTRATSAQIGSGDAFVEHVTTGGQELQVPGVLNYVFSTTPAIQSYSVDGGGAGTFSYPVAEGTPGTMTHPIAAPATGDVILHVTFWRPQRRPITGAGETGWMDMGGLGYSFDVGNPMSPPTPGVPPAPPIHPVGGCQASTVTPGPGFGPGSDPMLGLFDAATDQPADPSHTLTLSVNLTACIAAAGGSWTSGQTLMVGLTARSVNNDNAAENIQLKRL